MSTAMRVVMMNAAAEADKKAQRKRALADASVEQGEALQGPGPAPKRSSINIGVYLAMTGFGMMLSVVGGPLAKLVAADDSVPPAMVTMASWLPAMGVVIVFLGFVSLSMGFALALQDQRR